MIRCFAFVVCGLLAAAAIPTVVVAETPNIVLILADDMGLDSVAAFNDKLGLKTPNIDRLAREGMSFTDAHSTSAVCTPTRYGVLTGRYNWRSRLKRGIVGRWERPLIADGRLTLPEMLAEHGYDTACIGKWHLGWHWPKKGGGVTTRVGQIDFTAPIKGGPNDHGFDYYFGDDVPNWPPYAWRENELLKDKITTQMKAGAMLGVSAGPAVANWDFSAVLPEYARRCASHIRAQAKSEKPFFLYFPMPSPHTPIAPNKTFQGRTGAGVYADFLVETDWAIGQVLGALDDSGQAENTLLIFLCDNGTSPKANFAHLNAAGIHLNHHWRGSKADIYEGGHRVPTIVRWPGHIAGGERSNETVSSTDIMATCAEVVGHQLRDNTAEDSVSLLSICQGKPSKSPLHEIVVHHSASGHFAVRQGKWKLCFSHGSGGWSSPREGEAKKQGLPPIQLFDMENDPKETTNLQARHPVVVKELTAALRHMVEQGRSTPGAKQPNHAGKIWWPGLPWKAPKGG